MSGRTWNYRVLEYETCLSGERCFGIHEVYYDEEGRVQSWTERAVGVTAYSVEGLAEEMDIMREALAKSVLKEVDLMRESRDRKVDGEELDP